MARGFDWERSSCETQGLDEGRLKALTDDLAKRGTQALLVIRHDRIVWEWYAPGRDAHTRHYTASLAKALVGGMSLLVALSDGRMGVDDPACKYIPRWKDHPVKSQITIRHLATHTSGIDDANEPGKTHEELNGWKGAFWQDPDPFPVSLDQAPVLFPPGSRYAYSNPGMAALACAVTASLRGAPQSDLRALLRERIMEPIGVPAEEWEIGYGRPFRIDGLEVVPNWGGGDYTARAVARVGRLMLHKGNWEGRQLIPSSWVERMVSDAGAPRPETGPDDPSPASGLCWGVNSNGAWSRVPRDAFAGVGAGHQMLLVIPSLDLIVVRQGESLSDAARGESYGAGFVQHLLNPLMEAVVGYTAGSPYPPSPVIRSVTFGPEAAIVREAIGSDNWPITWGDDGEQYTSYGDGWGFAPGTESKLSLGLAKIVGGPTDFRGVNLRAPTAERQGDGAAGPKASGMLMVEGVLYMLVRNVRNSQLAWSKDHGRTWQWGFRFETSFGCPSFLNFGRNYQGAPWDYVYVYSSDGPSAYESYDHVVLSRVPKGRIREREAYEFFAGLVGGKPVWSPDLGRRVPVFSFPRHCQRLDAAYCAGVGRYLLALGYNQHGGWGLFDAPQPWGPWTTAFHTENWGLGDTHGYRLPAKWMSDDGGAMHLVFSGREHDGVEYDAFCVRRLTLDVAAVR